MSSSERSEASQSIPSSAFIEDARPLSDTPSRTVDFLPGLGRLASSKDERKGLRMPV